MKRKCIQIYLYFHKGSQLDRDIANKPITDIFFNKTNENENNKFNRSHDIWFFDSSGEFFCHFVIISLCCEIKIRKKCQKYYYNLIEIKAAI